jgi:hypothetical protein
MSQRTAQFVLIAIIAAQIAIYQFGIMKPEAQLAFSGLAVLIQGWMTNSAYDRKPDGTKDHPDV